MGRPRRLLTIGHSYVVALNRRLAHEIAVAGANAWEVTVLAPRFVPGDLRPISLERCFGEAATILEAEYYLSRYPHAAVYGREAMGAVRQTWDLVHCWEEPYVAAGFQVAYNARPSVPFIFWTAQNIPKGYPPPFRWFERYCVGRAAGWLACGQTTVDAQLARGYGIKRHRVMPLGVDTRTFRPDAVAGAAVRRAIGWNSNGPPVVGYLGRFVPEKGLHLLMLALDAVRTPWRALFVGGGPLEGELRAWATRSSDRVRIVTGIPHDLVPAHLNAMDLLAAPSQTLPRWKEQLGRMLLEAFACGVPIIGSDSGEIPQVVANAGRVVGEADVLGWEKAIGELIDAPDIRRELAQRGRQRAEQEYAWPVIARRHLEFFEERIASRE